MSKKIQKIKNPDLNYFHLINDSDTMKIKSTTKDNFRFKTDLDFIDPYNCKIILSQTSEELVPSKYLLYPITRSVLTLNPNFVLCNLEFSNYDFKIRNAGYPAKINLELSSKFKLTPDERLLIPQEKEYDLGLK